jgi:hypothetical protein
MALRAENGETQLIYNEDSNDEFESCYGSDGEEEVFTPEEEGQPQRDKTPTMTELAVQPATIIETTEVTIEEEKTAVKKRHRKNSNKTNTKADKQAGQKRQKKI